MGFLCDQDETPVASLPQSRRSKRAQKPKEDRALPLKPAEKSQEEQRLEVTGPRVVHIDAHARPVDAPLQASQFFTKILRQLLHR